MIRRALLAALLALAAWTVSASGATGSLVGIHPARSDESWIVLRLDPGERARASAVLVNLTDRPQTAELGTADGVTTADGVFTLAGAGEAPTGVGAWIDVPAGRVALAPGERRTVPVTVRVPDDAEPGDHAGGLVLQSGSAARAAAGEGVAVRVVERVGLRVYVTVTGERDESLAVDDLRARTVGGSGVRDAVGLPGAVDVDFTVRHAGNVRFDRLRGVVELRGGDGDVRLARALDLGTVLPGAVRPVAVRLPLDGWTPSDYEVAVRLHDAPAAQATAGVGIDPLRPVATGALALAVVGTGLWSRRRRAR